MIGLLLLTVEPAPTGIWWWCSGFAFVVFVLFAATSMTIFRRLDLRHLQSYARATDVVFYLFGMVGAAVTLLQLYNAIILGVFWPFFAGIVFQLTAAIARVPERQGRECPSGMSLPHCFGVMKTTVVDTKPPRFQFGVDFNEAFAETDVAPGVILLRLNWSGNHRIDSDNRH
jgi:multidrug transporter EmrE-like cation transporter